ncbi:MAG: DUF5009 domain-containing protein [Carboxylicivirga sp.]|nr:DUF5009 domain-containing protein [Carboxylicivirga sp.]
MNKRLNSLDVLRGMDMIWIIGLEHIVRVIANNHDNALFNWIESQTHHGWEGLRLYDLIFPLFMFISGVSIYLSTKKQLANNVPKKKIALKVIRRGLTLILLGVIYNGLGYVELSELRVASVLGQIGVGYLFTSLIVLYFPSTKIQWFFFGGIVLSYTILQLFIPSPLGAAGSFGEHSINAWFDQTFLLGRRYNGAFDPEGILCNFSGIATTLAGCLITPILTSSTLTTKNKLLKLYAMGTSALIIGFSASFVYPIIKSMWTSTFNLAAIGFSTIYLTTIYYIVDIKKFDRWTYIFKIIGLNSITIYLLHRFVNFQSISHKFLHNLGELLGSYSDAIIWSGALALQLIILHMLYKHKIFLKV